MSSSLPLQIAETIQTASINRHPSPDHDLNPSTTASQKQPVSISDPEPPASESSLDKYAYDDEESIDEEDDDDDDIPYSVLKPVPRRLSFGPLPDLRFEQSYLASIAGAETNWRVAYITMRDQVLLPLIQGTVWSLALHGWRFWNRSAKLSGQGVGARVRRWWYKTNNWQMPKSLKSFGNDKKLAADVEYYYKTHDAGGD
ncbi:Uncharacterized protein LHYA1_G004000 [Lachnellula hyalina]|uniref:DUF1770 domain-containing protein n=1 Tax=Lachnellula hyalina TaxID=1316788 RepID=A0A8H8U0L0_9HELO|nr:Uncharacterized protein LHYA1_G004000 [Lachnellula hyalina]TVY26141.1 Uncharacterized protein LHYA1_G004000 [Lachnellula hyalina]